MTHNLTPADIMGGPLDQLIGRLWDACGEFVEQRKVLMRRRPDRDALIRAAMPAGADRPDAQLARAVAADATMPRYLYVNARQWEDQPVQLTEFVRMMDLKVLTSPQIPENTAHLTRDEFNPDEVGKAMRAARKGERPLPRLA